MQISRLLSIATLHRLAVACLVLAFLLPAGAVRATLSGWLSSGRIQDAEIENEASDEVMVASARRQRVRGQSHPRAHFRGFRAEKAYSRLSEASPTPVSSVNHPMRC